MEFNTGFKISAAHVYVLIVVTAFVLFFKLNAPTIYILDEARNAQAGREMYHSKNYIVPTFNGELRSHKPVLHYWFMQAGYAMFGETAFAARFFSAVMGLITIIVTFFYTRRFLGLTVAFCTALALALSTHFLFEFRLAVPDPYLICFSTIATFAAFSYLQRGNKWELFLSAFSFALATLAKGPVAIALPGLALLIWVAWKKEWNKILTWTFPVAAIIFIAVALPWYLAVHRATKGQWTQEFFFKHNFSRFSEEMEGHGGIFLITIAIVLLGMLPFSAFLGELLRKRKIIFKTPLVQFATIVTIVFTGFYCISSTKLPNYPMPCYPFFAVVIGYFISMLITEKMVSKRYPLYILTGVMTAISVAGYFAIQQEVEAKNLAWTALTLLIGPWMMIAFLVANRRQMNWWKRVLIIAISFTFFNIVLLHVVYPRLYAQNPVNKTIHLVRTSRHVYAYQIYNPGYNFYLDSTIHEFTSPDSLRSTLALHPDAIVISRKEFVNDLSNLNLTVMSEHHDIFENPTTVILRKNAAKP